VSTGSGAEAIELARTTHPDLVLLDLGLPDVPGEEVAREIRADSPVPIVMLTAKAAEEHRIRGLELGADDYVTKPFSPRELVLRVRAVLRRVAGTEPTDTPASFGDGELLIDDDRHEAVVRGVVADLTPTEWGILTTLARVPAACIHGTSSSTASMGTSSRGTSGRSIPTCGTCAARSSAIRTHR